MEQRAARRAGRAGLRLTGQAADGAARRDRSLSRTGLAPPRRQRTWSGLRPVGQTQTSHAEGCRPTGRIPSPMARTTTRRTHRAPGPKPARRTRKTPIRSKTPQRKRAPSRTSLSQRRDLIGGVLLALGVFLACVEYLGWNGGVVGAKLRRPAAPAGGAGGGDRAAAAGGRGRAVFLDSPLRHVRPLRAGRDPALRRLDAGVLSHRHAHRRAPRRPARRLRADRCWRG